VNLMRTLKPLLCVPAVGQGLVLAAVLIVSSGPERAAGQAPKEGAPTADSWGRERPLTTGPGPRQLSYNFARLLAADETGQVHLVWYEARDGKEHVIYKRSTDEGTNWEPEFSLSDASERMPGDRLLPAVAAAGPNVYAVWHELREGKVAVYFRRSTDGGKNWQSPIKLSNSPVNSAVPSVAVTGSDVHVIWVDMREGLGDIYYRRSTDGGATWEDEKRLSDKPEIPNKATVSYVPSIAASGDTVVVVWVDTRDGNEEEYVKVSNDRGKTWSKDARLSDHPGNSWAPSVAVSGKAVHLVWFDQMDSPVQPADAENKLDEVMTLVGLPPLGLGLAGSHVPHPEMAAKQRATERMHLIQEESQGWIEKGGDGEELQRILREFHEMAQPTGLSQAEAKMNEALQLVGLPVEKTPLEEKDSAVLVKRIQDKAKMVQAAAPNWVQKGGDPKKLEALFQEFEGLMLAGGGAGYIEKEEKLDEAIKLMALKFTPGPLTDVPLVDHGEARAMRVRVRMRRIQSAAPAWIMKGGAPKKLDEAVREFHQAMEKATKEWEIYYRRSTDGGATWGETIRLTNSAGLSHRPSVAIAGNNVHLVWWDDRDGNNEVYYKHSADGGVSWGEDVRLTTAAGDSHFPAVAVSRNFVHVVWLDSRDGSPQVYYLRKLSK
jgi:hypothetical protein